MKKNLKKLEAVVRKTKCFRKKHQLADNHSRPNYLKKIIAFSGNAIIN